MRRILLALTAALALAGCAERQWASDDAVRAASVANNGPTTITLYTVISTRNGSGGHTGLLINGNQRVMFDPAGTWHHPRLPERNDVHFGMTDQMVNYYIDYHARVTWDVVEQTVPVSPAVAALVMQRAMEHGAVPKMQCAAATSSILRGVPGFESLPSTWSPVKLMEAFGKLPGVTSRKITDDDADNNHGVLIVQAGAANATE